MSGGASPEFEARLAAVAQKLEAEGAFIKRDPLAAARPFKPYIDDSGAERCPIDNADQPPEVDVHDDSKRLPPSGAAAHRVIDFLSWFGDGEIMGRDGEVLARHAKPAPPLYARDLSVLASLALGRETP